MNRKSTPHSSAPPAAAKGFTLLELTTVMVIIAIMFAVMLPAFGRFYRRSQSEAVVRAVTRVARYASQKAIFQKRIVTMQVDMDSRLYWVTIPANPDDPMSEDKRELESGLPAGYAFEAVYMHEAQEEKRSGVVPINFYPDGTADEVALKMYREPIGRSQRMEFALVVEHNTSAVKPGWLMKDEQQWWK